MYQRAEEGIKKAIVSYLKLLPSKTTQVEEYTLSVISEKVKADISKVEVAMNELKDKGLIDVRKVQLDVYVPKDQEGSQILATFAKKKYITSSSYWAAFFGFVLLFGPMLVWGNSIQPPATITALADAHVTGLLYGMIASFLACVIGGLVIQNLLTRFRCWQITSDAGS